MKKQLKIKCPNKNPYIKKHFPNYKKATPQQKHFAEFIAALYARKATAQEFKEERSRFLQINSF